MVPNKGIWERAWSNCLLAGKAKLGFMGINQKEKAKSSYTKAEQTKLDLFSATHLDQYSF